MPCTLGWFDPPALALTAQRIAALSNDKGNSFMTMFLNLLLFTDDAVAKPG